MLIESGIPGSSREDSLWKKEKAQFERSLHYWNILGKSVMHALNFSCHANQT